MYLLKEPSSCSISLSSALLPSLHENPHVIPVWLTFLCCLFEGVLLSVRG